MIATKPLLARRAGELMSRELVLLPQEMSLRAAAKRLSQSGISGAPVVDADGRCIGVLSASDIVRWAGQGGRPDRPRFARGTCVCSDWQWLNVEALPCDEVASYMTADPVTVAPGMSIGAVARTMLDAQIHRVIVVDERGRPVGLVSSTDILAAVAAARTVYEEPWQEPWESKTERRTRS